MARGSCGTLTVRTALRPLTRAPLALRLLSDRNLDCSQVPSQRRRALPQDRGGRRQASPVARRNHSRPDDGRGERRPRAAVLLAARWHSARTGARRAPRRLHHLALVVARLGTVGVVWRRRRRASVADAATMRAARTRASTRHISIAYHIIYCNGR